MTQSKARLNLRKYLLLYLDALFSSFVLGAGEAFFTAYSIELGHGGFKAGILATVPVVIGGIGQGFTSILLKKVASYKSFVLRLGWCQVFIFLILTITQAQAQESFYYLLFMVSLYWIAALSALPSWNSWIAKSFKAREYEAIFSKRGISIGLGGGLGLIFSAWLLESSRLKGNALDQFVIIFIFCAFIRMSSLLCLHIFPKSDYLPSKSSLFFWKEFLHFENAHLVKKFILYISSFKFGVFFSAAFFTPYMLVQLKFNYWQFSVIILIAYLGRIISGIILKRMLSRISVQKLLLLSSFGISLIPLFWVLSKKFLFLFSLEFFTGVLWGCFDLSWSLLSFSLAPEEKQEPFVRIFNLSHTFAIGLGCILGAWVFLNPLMGVNSYLYVFCCSTMIRLFSLLLFPRGKILVKDKKDRLRGLIASLRMTSFRLNSGVVKRLSSKFYNHSKK